MEGARPGVEGGTRPISYIFNAQQEEHTLDWRGATGCLQLESRCPTTICILYTGTCMYSVGMVQILHIHVNALYWSCNKGPYSVHVHVIKTDLGFCCFCQSNLWIEYRYT